jgi:hypothetical protein
MVVDFGKTLEVQLQQWLKLLQIEISKEVWNFMIVNSWQMYWEQFQQ